MKNLRAIVIKVPTSLFLINLNQPKIEDIQSFCNQGLSEGIRLDYKEEITDNLKLAKTICAFANTQGGIILVGVKADKTKNIPIAISGIELKEGLEEKVINICLGNISPPVTPEVKVIDFKSNLNESKNDRAVLFIRIQPSYTPPHYLLKTNEIPVRVHNRNSLADLRTIERLIEKREDVISGSSQSYPFHDSKEIQLEDVSIETVVVTPRYRTDSTIIYYYTKEKSDWLFRKAMEIMRLVEQRPEEWQIKFVGLNSARQVTRYCSIRKDGEIICQRTATVGNNQFYPLTSLEFVNKVMKKAKEIYENFGFYGDFSVGLTVVLTEPHSIHLPNIRLYDDYRSKNNKIMVSNNLTFDELHNNQNILEELFKDLCILFGLVLPEKTISELIKKISDN